MNKKVQITKFANPRLLQERTAPILNEFLLFFSSAEGDIFSIFPYVPSGFQIEHKLM